MGVAALRYLHCRATMSTTMNYHRVTAPSECTERLSDWGDSSVRMVVSSSLKQSLIDGPETATACASPFKALPTSSFAVQCSAPQAWPVATILPAAHGPRTMQTMYTTRQQTSTVLFLLFLRRQPWSLPILPSFPQQLLTSLYRTLLDHLQSPSFDIRSISLLARPSLAARTCSIALAHQCQ